MQGLLINIYYHVQTCSCELMQPILGEIGVSNTLGTNALHDLNCLRILLLKYLCISSLLIKYLGGGPFTTTECMAEAA